MGSAEDVAVRAAVQNVSCRFLGSEASVSLSIFFRTSHRSYAFYSRVHIPSYLFQPSNTSNPFCVLAPSPVALSGIACLLAVHVFVWPESHCFLWSSRCPRLLLSTLDVRPMLCNSVISARRQTTCCGAIDPTRSFWNLAAL